MPRADPVVVPGGMGADRGRYDTMSASFFAPLPGDDDLPPLMSVSDILQTPSPFPPLTFNSLMTDRDIENGPDSGRIPGKSKKAPPREYRVHATLWQHTRFKPSEKKKDIFWLLPNIWFEIMQYLDIKSTEKLISGLFHIFCNIGVIPSDVHHMLPGLRSWFGHAGALYEILTRHPINVAEDIFSQLPGKQRSNLLFSIYYLLDTDR